MEFQAIRVPREPAVGEYPTNLAVEFLHQIFVAHVEDDARQCRIPVAHEPTVRGVIAGYLAQIVREGVRLLEQRLVDGVTSCHRMPGQVNDSGRWKAQVDGTAVEIIEREFIDEMRAVSGSGPSAGEVVLTYGAKVYLRGCRNQFAPRQSRD